MTRVSLKRWREAVWHETEIAQEVAAGGQRRISRRNIVLGVLLVVLVVAMSLLVTLIVRLRIDRVPAALTKYEAFRGELQALDTSARALKKAHLDFVTTGDRLSPAELAAVLPAVVRRLDLLRDASCPRGDKPPGHTVRIRNLRSDFAAYVELAKGTGVEPGIVPTAGARALPLLLEGDAVFTSIQAALQEVEGGAQVCFRVVIDDIWDKAAETKRQAETLLFLIAFTVIALLLLRRGEQAHLRDQLNFNQQLIDAIPLPLSLRSPTGKFMLVNRAFEGKHGVQRDEVLGNRVRDMLPPEDAEAIAYMDARALVSDEPMEEHFHVVNEHVDRHVQVRVQALRRPDGSIVGTIGVQTDVTTLRRKEAQLTEINTKLSQLSIKMIDAQEDERRRIARDLHDHVGQILTALKLQLASLAKRPSIDQPATAFATPIDLAEEALRHARDLSASLHPHLLDDLGLEPALNWLIDRFIRPSVPNVELRCRLQPARGPEASEMVAFRVVQEALTNVVRHAGATRAGVMLESMDGQLTIEVIDDGVGFEAGISWFDLQRSTSLGVTSMRDRVTEIGGDLHMDSHPGSGTSVRVHLPWAT
ncbi:MAG TPA: PAS domain-containing protein [Ramlibacter sp.]|nr:PAS domain-containing protein [Ramlibacter sp.]